MDFSNMTTSDIEQMMLGNAMKQHERLSQPDDGAKWLAMAQAMGSPTRTGSFGEGLGNVAGALGHYNTGEQVRKDSAYEAMNNALAIAYKQRMDLEEKKRILASKLRDSKQGFVSNELGALVYDKDTNKFEIAIPGGQMMKPYREYVENWTKIIRESGNYKDEEDLNRQANAAAIRSLNQQAGALGYDTRAFPTQIQSGEKPPVVPELPSSGGSLRTEDKVAAAMNGAGPGGIPDPSSPNVFGSPAHSDPTSDPRFKTAAGPSAALKTPQQIEQENTLARNIAEQDTKYVQAQRDALDAYRPTVDSINRMEQLTLNGTSEGPLSDLIATTGGVVNYFDPDSKLAKIAGDDAAYFSALQNLVRDKIAALGAGTAISNLDLIVTQSSVGGLLKTKQGRLKILGALKADAETARMIQEDKISHFEKTGGLKGYRPPTRPLVGMISKPQILPDGTTLNMYAPITVDKWMAAAKAKNPKATDAVLDREWTKFVKSFGGSK